MLLTRSSSAQEFDVGLGSCGWRNLMCMSFGTIFYDRIIRLEGVLGSIHIPKPSRFESQWSRELNPAD
jgi:hypothetical protein